jgi:acyl-CoA synthetase (AMP-forming)/AMP-acid ligase II
VKGSTLISHSDTFNVVSNVIGVASRFPDRVALKSPAVALSYRGLRSVVVAIAAHLRDRGLQNGGVLAIDVDNPIAALAAALAAGALGVVWAHATREVLETSALNVQMVLTDKRTEHILGSRLQILESSWFQLPPRMRSTPSVYFDGFQDAAQPFAVAQSSGTTGICKMMVISAENASSRSEPQNLLDTSEVPIVATYFHPLHQGNMWNILRVLRRGGCVLLGGSMENWLSSGATYVIGSPAHFLKDRDLILVQDRPRIAHAWIGGGPVHALQVSDLLKMFNTVHATYGASEAGIISAKSITRATWQDGPTRLGRPDQRCTVEIVDEHDRQLPNGVEGVVRVKSPWVVRGYIGDKDSTSRFFRNGTFYTGDLGVIDAAGELMITGRASEGMNVGGTKFNPALIDEIIMRHPLVDDAICFVERAEDGRDVLSVVLRPRGMVRLDDCLSEIVTAIATQFGKSRIPQNVYETLDMPRNHNGKALRLRAPSITHQFRRIR